MRYWHEVKRFEKEQFLVIIDWTYEDLALGDCFDETIFDLDDMIDRCNRGIDTHYVARVRFMYDDVEMAATTLGSCYASDCDPADDIENGLGGYLESLLEETESEARERAAEMLDRLKEDFLGSNKTVDNSSF